MLALRKCILMRLRIKCALTALFAALCSFSITSCTNNSTEPLKLSEYLLGTLVSITVYDYIPNGNEVIAECFGIIRELESTVSVNIDNSELSVLNKNAFNVPVPVSDTLFRIISRSMEFCALSDGAFDIGLGKLIDLWGIGTSGQRIPTDSELSPYIGFKGYEYIVLNETDRTVQFTDERVKINLGACAKGYAEDIIRDHLISKGIESALLDFGGSITAIGDKNGEKFRIGIANPYNEYEYSCIIPLSDSSSVTSGDYQRYFETDGKHYHHILDSSTGFPSESGISGVTVITDSAFEADCLSTSAFVLGKEEAVALLDKLGFGYVIISADGMTVSPTLEGLYEK